MQQTFTFTDGAGRRFSATINVLDLHKAAFALAKRARNQGRSKVNALEGAIELTLDEVA